MSVVSFALAVIFIISYSALPFFVYQKSCPSKNVCSSPNLKTWLRAWGWESSPVGYTHGKVTQRSTKHQVATWVGRAVVFGVEPAALPRGCWKPMN